MDILIPVIYDINMRHCFLAQLTQLYIASIEQEINVYDEFTEDVCTFLMSDFKIII